MLAENAEPAKNSAVDILTLSTLRGGHDRDIHPNHPGVLTAGLSVAAVHAASPPLVVHEWGTFTSFQDAKGKTIAGINVDDEPVPEFVHRLKDFENFQTTSMPAVWFQGAPRCYPGVTLRLETPVLYFYPPAGWQAAPFDVRATFVGGWLTEFYPAATTEGMDVLTAVDAACPWLAALAPGSSGPCGRIAQAQDRLACLAGAA